MNEPGLEFVWVGDDAIDPLQQAQTPNILVTAGIKTRDEARADLGLGAGGGKPPGAAAALGKYNHNHDERGRFATADSAVEPSGRHKARGVQAASLDTVTSDVIVSDRTENSSGATGETHRANLPSRGSRSTSGMMKPPDTPIVRTGPRLEYILSRLEGILLALQRRQRRCDI